MGDQPITPRMKVAELLREYPELEEVLLSLSPRFQKLRNPVLRATAAKVATLKQVADVGEIPVGALVNRLREAAGQKTTQEEDDATESGSSTEAHVSSEAAVTLDVREMLNRGEEPLALVLTELAKLPAGCMLKLITPFRPAPLIDIAAKKGFTVRCENLEAEIVHTYFQLPHDSPGPQAADLPGQ